MPTRSQTASTSLRMCDERKTVWPRSFASRTVSRNAISISGSRPLVGSSRISRSARRGERRDQLHLLAVALRERAHLLARCRAGSARPGRRGTRSSVPPRTRARNASVSAAVRAGHRNGSAGDVGHAPVGCDRVTPGVDAEELRPPGGRAEQPEQQPDRRRLAGAVRPEIAVDLARLRRSRSSPSRASVSP